MFKRFTLLLLGLLVPLVFATTVLAESVKTPINVFVREGCSHCTVEEDFLTRLVEQRADFEVFYHDIAEPEHYAHFDTLTTLEQLPKATPITLVGNTIVQGFGSAQTTGTLIIGLLDASRGQATLSFEEFIAAGGSRGRVQSYKDALCVDTDQQCFAADSEKFLVDIPFFGVVDVASYSLPTLSIVLGFVDGFNPCAMWVLVTFLIVLVQIGDKRKMFQIAGLFIIAETIMYYAILNVWFTTWDFVGLDRYVTPLVGAIAIGGGFFFLYEGLTSDGTCSVTNSQQRHKIHTRIKDLVAQPLTWITAAGVLGLAFSVNIIEFACSIGIPQAFTKILQLNELSTLTQQGLILLYTLFYMVDDLIVFGIALVGIQYLGVTQKYSKYTNLLGGVIMLILGFLLIFAPELLQFV